ASFPIGTVDILAGDLDELRRADQRRARGDATLAHFRRDRRAIEMLDREHGLTPRDVLIANTGPADGLEIPSPRARPFRGASPVVRNLDRHLRRLARQRI